MPQPEQRVRARAVRHRDVQLGQQGDIGRVREHRVDRDGVGTEHIAERVQVLCLAGRLEQVGRDRQPPPAGEGDQHGVVVVRDRERRMRRDAGGHEVRDGQRGERRLDPALEPLPDAEPLQVDDRAQPGLTGRPCDRAGVAAVRDGRDAAGQAGRRSGPGLVEQVGLGLSVLAADVVGDPGRERHPVAEPCHGGVLEVRVRVHEAGQDHRVRESLVLAAVRGPDGDDAAVLDLDLAVGDRRAVHRDDPVGCEDHPKGSERTSLRPRLGSTALTRKYESQ